MEKEVAVQLETPGVEVEIHSTAAEEFLDAPEATDPASPKEVVVYQPDVSVALEVEVETSRASPIRAKEPSLPQQQRPSTSQKSSTGERRSISG